MCDRRSSVHRSPDPKRRPIFSPSLSQSSVDHKEFKRCGPFDPYINAKVCTHSADENSFYCEVLLCSPAVSACCAVLCWAVLCLGLFCLLLLEGATILQEHKELSFPLVTRQLQSSLTFFPTLVKTFSTECIRNSFHLKRGSFHLSKHRVWR